MKKRRTPLNGEPVLVVIFEGALGALIEPATLLVLLTPSIHHILISYSQQQDLTEVSL